MDQQMQQAQLSMVYQEKGLKLADTTLEPL